MNEIGGLLDSRFGAFRKEIGSDFGAFRKEIASDLDTFRNSIVSDIGEVIEQNITPQLDKIYFKQQEHDRRFDSLTATVADQGVKQRKLVQILNHKKILTNDESHDLAGSELKHRPV